MKIAELFNKYFTMLSDQPVLSKDAFEKAIIEHDKEIISKIDEMIKLNEELNLDIFYAGKVSALTELKQWIQGDKK